MYKVRGRWGKRVHLRRRQAQCARRWARVVGGCQFRGRAWGSHADGLREKNTETEHVRDLSSLMVPGYCQGLLGAGEREFPGTFCTGRRMSPTFTCHVARLSVTLRWLRGWGAGGNGRKYLRSSVIVFMRVRRVRMTVSC